jgi:hypothetical protein
MISYWLKSNVSTTRKLEEEEENKKMNPECIQQQMKSTRKYTVGFIWDFEKKKKKKKRRE